MRRSLSLLLSSAFLIAATVASAQAPPSEARIRADVLAQVHPTATAVTVRGNGSRQLNGGVYEFVVSITARKPYPEMEGVEIESYGDVVYQSHGSTYQYDRYRTGDWRYFGIPDPSVEEVIALLESNPNKLFTSRVLEGYELLGLGDAETVWHNPESVTVTVRLRFRRKKSNIEISTIESETPVRLYREGLSGPWTNVIAMQGRETEIGTETLPEATVRAMRTVREATAVAELEADAAALPSVEVPSFSTGRELADYIYRTARESGGPTFEATVRALLAPRHRVEGSQTAVTLRAQQEIVDPLSAAFAVPASSFAEQACPTPVINQERTRNSDERFYYTSALDGKPGGRSDQVVLMVKVDAVPGGYRNGQPLPPSLALGDVELYVSQDPDDLAYLASFDDPTALCPDVSAQAAQDATPGVQDDVRGAVEGAVQQGRRRLGRLLGRGN